MMKSLRMKTLLLLGMMITGVAAWAQAPVNTVLWSETWTGGGTESVGDYGFTGTSVYGNATLTYASSNLNTGLYQATLAGGTAPELLLSKNNETWTINNIPTGQAKEMSLSFLSNKTTFALTSSTSGISISGSQKSWTIKVTGNVSNFNLTLKNTGSANARIDNVELKVTTAGSNVPATYSVTYDANGGSGTMVDANSPYEANKTVTLLTNSFTAPTEMIWDAWEVKDASNNAITVTNNQFTMPASNVTVKAKWVTDPNIPTYNWVKTNFADLTSNDVFVIVGNNGSNYALPNNGGASAPTAETVTIDNDKITSDVTNSLKWAISGDASDGCTFYPYGSTTTYLYCLDNNSGLRVGTPNSGTTYSNKFKQHSSGYFYTTVNAKDRYVGIYNSQDWRSYTSYTGNSNIANQTFAFYKRVDANAQPDPSIAVSDVNIEYNATGGSIPYTISNGVDGGSLSANVTEGDWLTIDQGTESPISFTCSANNSIVERTATVTLIYSYGDNNTVTETLTVTQAEAPFVPSTYTLATSITSGKTYIIVNKESSMAMGVQNDKNRAAVEVVLNNDEITVESSPTFYEFVITYLGKDGNNKKLYSIYDAAKEGGYLYAASSNNNYLRTKAELDVNGKWAITIGTDGIASIVAQGTYLKNVMQYNSGSTLFSCYGSASQNPVYLYEKVEPAITSVEITMNQFGVMTYAYDKPLDFSSVEGLTAYAATGINGSALTMTKVEQAAAAEGLMLEGTPNATYTVPVSSTTPDEASDNMLVGLTVAMPVKQVENGNTTFILANGNDGVNWYKLEETSYTLKANSAYLRLTADQVSQLGQGTRGLTMVYGSDSDGIESISREATTYLYFDLSGRRVENPTKGLYIVNGKKVNVK